MSPKRSLPPHKAAVTLLWLSSAISLGLGYVLPLLRPDYNDFSPFDPDDYPVNQDLFSHDPPRSSLQLFRNPSYQLQPAPSVRLQQILPLQNGPGSPFQNPQPTPVQNLLGVQTQPPSRLANKKDSPSIQIQGFNNITIKGSNSGNVNVCGKGGPGANGTVDHSGDKVVNFKGYNNNNIHGSFAGNVNNGHVYINIDMGAMNVTELFNNKRILDTVTNVTELRAEYLYEEIKKLQLLEERNKTLGNWFPRTRKPRV